MIITLVYGLAFIVNQKQKTTFTSWGKFIAEFKFYNQLDPGTKDKKKPRHESRKMVLNKAQGYRLKKAETKSCCKLNYDQLLDMLHTQN